MNKYAMVRKAKPLDPTILRAYDIRGVIGETLSAEDACAIGWAFGSQLSRRGWSRVCVGYDGRLSSPELEIALVDGLMRAGMHVTRVGLGPTPMLYFAVKYLWSDAGIMISGSHNPPQYNGFKLTTREGSFYGEDIQTLGRVVAAGDYVVSDGSQEDRPMLDNYVDRLVQDFEGDRPLKVAWDAGNGSAGKAMEMMCARLPGEHILLNEVIDGTFPAHHPDPTIPEYLVQLEQAVKDQGCELGIAFDGDGDRIGIIDSTGRILWGDQLLIILARDILARNPGAQVIADVKASQTLFDEIESLGGKPLMWRTGHSLIKAKMAETGAPLAGEMSGHIFIADRYYGYDDALYAAIRILGCISRGSQTLTEIREELPSPINTPELRFPCSDTRKFEVIEEVRARLVASGADMNDIDGVRVCTKDGWWLLRASNTQDALVVRCEANAAAGLDRLKAALSEQFRLSGLDAPVI